MNTFPLEMRIICKEFKKKKRCNLEIVNHLKREAASLKCGFDTDYLWQGSSIIYQSLFSEVHFNIFIAMDKTLGITTIILS